MKLFLTLLFLLSLGYAKADYKGVPQEIFLPTEQVQVIANESTQDYKLIIEGFLPNFCHESPIVAVNVYEKLITVDIKALSYDPSSPFCPEALKAYQEKLNFDQLPDGDYEIIINEHTDFEQNYFLTIRK